MISTAGAVARRALLGLQTGLPITGPSPLTLRCRLQSPTLVPVRFWKAGPKQRAEKAAKAAENAAKSPHEQLPAAAHPRLKKGPRKLSPPPQSASSPKLILSKAEARGNKGRKQQQTHAHAQAKAQAEKRALGKLRLLEQKGFEVSWDGGAGGRGGGGGAVSALGTVRFDARAVAPGLAGSLEAKGVGASFKEAQGRAAVDLLGQVRGAKGLRRGCSHRHVFLNTLEASLWLHFLVVCVDVRTA